MKEVKTSSQIWQTKNANDLQFSNGDIIPLASNKAQWSFNIANKIPTAIEFEIEGVKQMFYNHFAVNDIRGIGKNGFRVPNLNDHDTLIQYIGGWEIVDRAKKFCDILHLSNSFNGNLDFNGNHIGEGLYGAWWLNLKDTPMPLHQSLYFCLNSNLSYEDSNWRKQTYVDRGYQLRLVKDIV